MTNTAAIPPELVARYGVTLMPMQINFLDGQYEEGSEITTDFQFSILNSQFSRHALFPPHA